MLALALQGIAVRHEPLAGNFYAVFPHNLLVGLFGAVFAFALLALAIGVRRFWRQASAGPVPAARRPPRPRAMRCA